jgi:HK97 family phage major capsid protein
MNRLLFKRYKHLTALFTVIACAVLFAALNILHPITAACCVGLYQLSQFAMSKRSLHCYNGVLTPEQIKEFDTICKELKPLGEHVPLLKELAGKEGGWAAIKLLPELLNGEKKRVDELQGDVGKLRKQLAKRGAGGTGVRWVGNVPFVTDDCANYLAAQFVSDCAHMGEKAMNQLNPNVRAHQGLILKAFEVLGVEAKASEQGRFYSGIEIKTAMSDTQAPLPTTFVSQIVELVFAFGQARQYGTVYPLGGGTTKLPRLAAGEDAFGYLGVGTAGMSQAIAEKRVAAELISFDPNKAGGLIRIPTELEEDTFIQLGQFLARYIARRFAYLEDDTMFNGDGTASYANQQGVGPYCAANVAYLRKLDAGKTKVSDATLDDFRAIRGLVSAAVLANMAANGQTNAAYYLHPSLEPLLASFNKYPNFVVFKNEGGKATLDGWPIRWIGVSAVHNGVAQAEDFVAFFGDLSYWYLGERGHVRLEVSREVFFATDELAMRALERIDINGMAVDAMSTLQLGAAA